MVTENTPPPTGKETTKQHSIDEATKINNVEDINEKVISKLYSKQPRFTTTEIIQKFPNVNNRYCQKIGFSVPWNNIECPPNNDTYYSAIRQIFKLIKEYDPQFQLLPWNIAKHNCNPILKEEHIPTSHLELKEYIYDLHLQPKRIRAAMVVTSSHNLKEILKQQTMALKSSKTLLNSMRQAKIYMKPLNIQTLGEIKLVGFLQFIHPHFTNIKNLLVELQSILETKDITIEMYRPSAISKDNKILDAPEALAIGAPSDISVAVYKSLIEKWKGIQNGEYDIIIGNDSLLKDGFFIPFSSNLLNRESRNQAVFAHKSFLKEYTCIHLKRCNSVDIEFTITKQEADAMQFILNDDKQQIITLRDIILCWTEPNSDALLVHTIQSMSGNKKTLLVKKKFKEYITTEILQILNILEKRKDFNKICGNSEEFGACIDKFVISKSGRSYLSSIRIPSKSRSISITEQSNIEQNREKRKRPTFIDASATSIDSSTKSPTHKKGNHDNNTSDNGRSSKPPMTYSQATIATSSHKTNDFKNTITSNDNPSTELTVLNPTNKIANEGRSTQSTATSMIPFIGTSTVEITTSTLTTEDQGKSISLQSITKIVDQQICEITTAMATKYENTIKSIQLSHSNQISQLTNKQKEQDTDIQSLREIQTTMKNDIEKKLEDKVESQTTILNSLVTMIQDMKTDQVVSKKRRKKKKKAPNVSQNDLTDCSFSDSGSAESLEDSVQLNKLHTDFPNACSKYKKSTKETIAALKQYNHNPKSLCKDYDENTIDSDEIETSENNNNNENIKDKPVAQSSCEQPTLQCKQHQNNIITSDDEDIRRRTRSQVANSIDSKKGKWEGITSKTKHSTKLHLALVSPTKQSHKGIKYDKGSPNYNQYDPSGTIVNKPRSKQTNSKDHTNDQQRVLRSGRKT